jgi:hypothetical protein
MKKKYTSRCNFFNYKLIALIFLLTAGTQVFSQTYYSNFTSNVSSHLSITNPSGLFCLAPSLQNTDNVADADLTNYASFSSLLAVSLVCNPSLYKIRADINLNGNGTFVPAGYYAGFRINLSALVNLTVLGSDLSLSTYLNGTLQETVWNNSILNLSLLANTGGVTDIYFHTTKSFNQVEIDIDGALIPLSVLFEADFYYAFATSATLPIILNNFNVQASHANCMVSWSTLNQTNINSYEVERSTDAINYAEAGTVNVNSKEASYNFEDRSLLNGKYYYRVKIISDDGTFQYTGAKSATIAAGNNITVYPTLVSKGQPVYIKTNLSGNVTIQVFSFTGNLIKEMNSSGSSLTLPTGNLTSGMYIIKVTDQNQQSSIFKISCL